MEEWGGIGMSRVGWGNDRERRGGAQKEPSDRHETGRLSCWSFVEKTSVKQDPKPQVCSNFQTSFLHLSQTDAPSRASQVSLTFGQPLGQAHIQSDVPPSRGFW